MTKPLTKNHLPATALADEFLAAATAVLRSGEGCPCHDDLAAIDNRHVGCESKTCQVLLLRAELKLVCAGALAAALVTASRPPSDVVMECVIRHLDEASATYKAFWQALSLQQAGGKIQ